VIPAKEGRYGKKEESTIEIEKENIHFLVIEF